MGSTDAPPKTEYPRPQFRREAWRNLNGTWTFAFDPDETGRTQGWSNSTGFDREILVPYCPESTLSGVAHTEFIPSIWYHRLWSVPEHWEGHRILLHFGAVDWEARVWIDGREAGFHYGGAGAWSLDVTDLVRPGASHNLVVLARDDVRSLQQPAGKQSREPTSHSVYYTRVTGIWQTVWCEAVHPAGLSGLHARPSLAAGTLDLTLTLPRPERRHRVQAELRDPSSGEVVATAEAPAASAVDVRLTPADIRPWHPDDPHLYDLELRVLDAAASVVDQVSSYVGFRDVGIDGDRLLLNGEPFTPRFVLDQGYWPDGIWTSPDDDALVRDIELGKEAGFNGARLHQKAFEPRFHFHADRLGWLTWAEAPSWGIDENDPVAARNFLSEWSELVVRDRNHPSIVAWTPLNETEFLVVSDEHRRLVADAYYLTKRLDPSRPVNDASGWVHVVTDLWTVHAYTQDPEEMLDLMSGEVFRNQPEHEPSYTKQPYLVDEFGGILWQETEDDDAWGYGDAPRSREAFYQRLEGLVRALDASDRVAGWCYTQLTDVEQEQNGLYTYDRRAKFDVAKLRKIFRG